jgi:hypothetical protein
VIFLISLSAVALVLSDFFFIIAREAAPTILQRATTAQTAASTAQGTEIPNGAGGAGVVSRLSLDELKSLDEETIHFLAESVAKSAPSLSTIPTGASMRSLTARFFSPTAGMARSGRSIPWDPASPTRPKFNVIPLLTAR